MQQSNTFPDLDRLSILIATILLTYASGRITNFPTREISVQLPGVFLSLQINTNMVIALLVAGLTASGTYWVLETHPAIAEQGFVQRQHLILPALTALVIGVPLNNLPFVPLWWIVFVCGGFILLLVLTAEYMTVDSEIPHQPLAAGILISISFALFLILCISLRATGTRLFFMLPAVFLSAGMVGLRTLNLRSHGPWKPSQAIIVALVSGQFAAAFHYLPLSPIGFGLLLLGPAYALTTFLGNLSIGRTVRQSVVEPIIMLITITGIALWIR